MPEGVQDDDAPGMAEDARTRWEALPLVTRLYGLTLWWHWGAFGRECWESREVLADQAGTSERYVRRMEQQLANAGFLVRETRPRGRILRFTEAWREVRRDRGTLRPRYAQTSQGRYAQTPRERRERENKGPGPSPGPQRDPLAALGGPSSIRSTASEPPSLVGSSRDPDTEGFEQALVPSAPRVSKPKAARRPASGEHHELVRHWESEWARTRLGLEWAWQPKHFAAIAKLRKLARGQEDEVRRRMTRLLESQDPWLAKNADPGLLESRWNQLAVDVLGPKDVQDALAEQVLHDLRRMKASKTP